MVDAASRRASRLGQRRIDLVVAIRYVDELRTVAVDDYAEADLRVGYRLSGTVDFEVVARDVLDGRHQEYFPSSLFIVPAQAERALRLGLRWHF